MKSTRGIVACFVLALVLTGCDSRSPSNPPPPPPRFRSLEIWYGGVGGLVTVGSTSYDISGVLTVDGALRLRVGPSLALDAQFNGNLAIDGDRAFGTGVVIGQACPAFNPGAHCGEAARAEISLMGPISGPLGDRVVGEIRIAAGDQEEVWALDLGFGTAIGQGYDMWELGGTYRSVILGPYGYVTLRLTGDGLLSLERTTAGCSGSGTMAPHLDGRFNVVDVTLTIEGCDATSAYLNGAFEGLATYWPENPWELDPFYYFSIWLSTPVGAESPAALTLLVRESNDEIPVGISPQPWEGYFSGTATIGTTTNYAEALLSQAGAIRLYIGGSSSAVTDPTGSAQYVGYVVDQIDAARVVGTGVVIGQACASLEPNRFCAEPATGEISITVVQGSLSGQIRVETSTGEELWPLAMSWPTETYLEPATLEFAEGLYQEQLAEFSHSGETVVSVDAEGRLFFQNATSGCTANGGLAPHTDGAFNSYDVTLVMANCAAAFAYLNGDFQGLATRTIGGPWDYWGDWLVIWLSRSAEPGSPSAAVTMWASRL